MKLKKIAADSLMILKVVNGERIHISKKYEYVSRSITLISDLRLK